MKILTVRVGMACIPKQAVLRQMQSVLALHLLSINLLELNELRTPGQQSVLWMMRYVRHNVIQNAHHQEDRF